MRWMGAKNSHNDEVDVLITASQQDDIANDLISTGSWLLAEEKIPESQSMPIIENTPGSIRLVPDPRLDIHWHGIYGQKNFVT